MKPDPTTAPAVRPWRPRSRPVRIIDRLRRLHPEGTWSYDREHFGSRWACSDGRAVIACSEMAPRFDGDDDTFRTIYLWEGSLDRVDGLWLKW
jgi:hypothetical protein